MSQMRIKITFNNPASRTDLPINTNYYLVCLISALAKGYASYLRSLCSSDRGSKYFDMFTFSQLIIPLREIESRKISILSEQFYWYVASPYPQFLGIISSRLRSFKNIWIAGQSFEVDTIEFLPSPRFDGPEARFTCLSPVTVRRRRSAVKKAGNHSKYIFPFEEDYISFLEDDLLNKYNRLRSNKRDKLDFNLEFDRDYLRKRNNKIVKVITIEKDDEHNNQIRGVLAPLAIQADPDVLQLIYNTGLGHYNSMGFGMVERIQ